MILDSHKAIHEVRVLPFCYLCGETLTVAQNADHVPPSSIFLTDDRNFPLILPTHVKCNGDRSSEDQAIGQLIGLFHGKSPTAAHNKLKPRTGTFADGISALAIEGLDLRAIMRRWLRGFHAALYREFLPENTDSFMTVPPLPEGKRHEHGGEFLPIPEVVSHFL